MENRSTPPLSCLAVWVDPYPHAAAENMALDEALLEHPTATLRVYRWKSEAVSLGYFTPWKVLEQAEFAGREAVRRWTGGGVVLHDAGEITYALVVPISERLAQLRSSETYERIHRCLGEAIRSLGGEAELAKPDGPHASSAGCACFSRAVSADLVATDGRKIAGAAQRRNRRGLLHQGSLRCGEELDRGALAERFATRLASQISVFAGNIEASVLSDLSAKYGSPDWLGKF